MGVGGRYRKGVMVGGGGDRHGNGMCGRVDAVREWGVRAVREGGGGQGGGAGREWGVREEVREGSGGRGWGVREEVREGSLERG